MSFVITPVERRDPTSRFRQSYTAIYIHHTADNEVTGYEIYDNEVQKDWVFVSVLGLKPSAIERLNETLAEELEKRKNKTVNLEDNEIA